MNTNSSINPVTFVVILMLVIGIAFLFIEKAKKENYNPTCKELTEYWNEKCDPLDQFEKPSEQSFKCVDAFGLMGKKCDLAELSEKK